MRGAPPFLEGRSERVAAQPGEEKMSVVLEPAVDRRPGMDPRRLVRLMQAAVSELELDLRGRVVVTEAATGAYGVTPVLAGLAGARTVYAVAGDSRFGTAEQARAHTRGSRRRSRCRASGSRWSWARTPLRWRTPTS